MGTDRENIAPGNLCIMKANVRYLQKASCFKNSNHPWGSALF